MSVALALFLITRAQDVQAKKIDLHTFNEQTRRDIADLHRVMVIIAFGGYAQMIDESWNFADESVRFHQAFFDAWYAQLVTGERSLDDDAQVARVALYAAAGYATHENAIVVREQRAGMTLYRRRIVAGDNCEDCLRIYAEGYQLIGRLNPIGDSVCRSRCRCYYQFATGGVELIGKVD